MNRLLARADLVVQVKATASFVAVMAAIVAAVALHWWCYGSRPRKPPGVA